MTYLNSFVLIYPSFWFYAVWLLWSVGLILGSAGIGNWVLKKSGFLFVAPLTEWLISIGLGGVVLSYMVFIAAVCHGLNAVYLWSLNIVWCLSGFVWGLKRWRDFRTLNAVKPQGLGGWLVVGILGITVALNLVTVLTPAVDWDGLAYHLALPKIYLFQNGFVFRPDIFHNLFPQFTEMLYLLGLWLPYGMGAKTVHFGFGLLAALTLLALGQEQGWRNTAWLAVLVFYNQFIVHVESGTAFIDLTGAAYIALALLAFVNARRSAVSLRWFYLGVFFLGVNAATRWHGVVILELGLVLTGILFIGWNPFKNNLGRKWSWTIFLGHLPVLPYIMRAWLQGGNPVWPLAFTWFGGANWNLELARHLALFHQQFAGVRHDILGFVFLPYDFLIHGDKFGVGGDYLRGPFLGIIMLIAVWFMWGKKRASAAGDVLDRFSIAPRLAVGIGFVFVGIWFFSSPQVRFLLSLFPVIAWLAIGGLRQLWLENTSVFRRLVFVIAALLLLATHPPFHRYTITQIKVMLGKIRPEIYLTREHAHYPACVWLNQNVKPDETVLLFGENRGFYLDVPYLWGDPTVQAVVDYRTLQTDDDLEKHLHTLGVKWLLFRDDVYDAAYMNPELTRRVLAFARNRGRQVWASGAVRIFYFGNKRAFYQ